MCGICGVLHLDGAPADAQIVGAMTERLIHRGPDQGAVMVDGPVGLGNRRLAIQDLSPAGALPMRNAHGTLTIAYNGEIYNHLDLRREFTPDYPYCSTSDAETLLALYRAQDSNLLQGARGMFAFALWDRPNQRLLIARDRMGEKPLYYYHDSRILVFASEIKALLAHPAVPRESALDAETLALYLGYGYIPAPRTAFKGIHALLPGEMLDVRDGKIARKTYWEMPVPLGESYDAQERAAAHSVISVLEEAVRQCLISDVPLGAFLSGGLDSSLVVALMRRATNGAIKTFSIGFEGDDSFDETAYAKQVAQALGTDHTSFTVKPEAMSLLPKLVWHHDQPFGDSSAIPTYLVSQLTRQHVTVALTGDGGDELFAGYERFYAAALMRRLKIIPTPVWAGMDAVMARVPEGTGYYNVVKRARRFSAGAMQPAGLSYFSLVRLFSADLIHDLTGRNDDPAAADFNKLFWRAPSTADLLYANMRTYLPDDLLIKTDRSSMAASLETRAPFLDHVLVETAANIPANLKLKGRTTKYILKQAARGLLDDAIIDRPKHGFGVPLGAWLRQDIGEVRDTLLSPEARGRGLLDSAAVAALIDDHASGKRDHGQRLWALLTLEWWHRLFIDKQN